MATVVQCTRCELRFTSDAERQSHLRLDHGEAGEELAETLERIKEEQRRDPKAKVLERRRRQQRP